MMERAMMECRQPWKNRIGVAALCLLMGACQSADNFPNAPPLTTPFADRLAAALAEIERRDMAVLVATSHEGGPIRIRELGALVADGIPTGDTQIDINSITKTVTAVMAARLVERGALGFDETLGEIFEKVPADKAGITLHQLLTHSAGLRGSVGDDAERLSKEAFLERVFRSELRSSPGEIYHYSNAGYGVAAIIEERSGKSYERFLREDVIAGLGLDDTGYLSVYDDRLSMRSSEDSTIIEASWGGHGPFWNLIGNGGLVSTVGDMLRFRRAVAAGRIVSGKMVDLIQTPHVPEDSSGASFYGYGVVVQDVRGVGRRYWHDGGNGHFSAEWSDYVEQGDLLFTAGADSSAGDAFEAMSILESYLYGHQR